MKWADGKDIVIVAIYAQHQAAADTSGYKRLVFSPFFTLNAIITTTAALSSSIIFANIAQK